MATTDYWAEAPMNRQQMALSAPTLAEVNEGAAAAESVDRIEATFGQKPEKFLTDAGNNSGQIKESKSQTAKRTAPTYRRLLPLK